ncbi:mechanosensitive ion channel family protein [Pseudohoeflea coraliihabitans]|uniref:Mechanosensitive ion channel n=1 Tax=Pseudohoeflea coraliihabitans TaxID=2860393 RepID=A0ABS6WIK1_9HYPH|nr:mechanosensitive ion channel domain-containing protein [Pseudohoeflea sp. DP4N28-3]MBW3095783.1 mechanosensitive ion channel [Pseudohoeflea sp. DP4N28-3]
MVFSFARRLAGFLLLFALLQLPGLAIAQDAVTASDQPPAVAAAETALARSETRLSTLSEAVEDDAVDEAQLVELKVELDDLAQQMLEIGVSLRPVLSEIKARSTVLGDPPAEGAPAEAPETVAAREALAKERAQINALTGRAEAVSIRANRLGDMINERRKALFADTLTQRTPINGALFDQAASALSSEMRSFKSIVGSWVSFVWTFKFEALMASVFLSLLTGLFISMVGSRFIGRFINRDPANEAPSYLQRLTVAFWSAILPTAAVAAAFLAVLALMSAFSVLRDDITALLSAFSAAIIGLVLIARVAKGILAPRKPNWRLIRFTNRGARRIYHLILAMTLINAADFLLGKISSILGSPVIVTVVNSLVATILIGLILVGASRVKPMVGAAGDITAPGHAWPRWVQVALTVSGVGMVVLSLGGYVGLSKFISEQILLTGTILALIYIGFQSGHAVMEPGNFAQTRLGAKISRRFNPSAVRMDQIGLAAGLVIDVLVLIIGIPLILLQWGFRIQDIQLLLYRAVTNIQIGGISISLSGILIGLVLFIGLVVVTRLFQRWLDSTVMARSQMDPGVRNSIRTSIGYLGVVIAALFGVLAAGIDLSSLAIVAGALSLGIGFGLQNIVSNFVSGLILLAERPFKAGDWVQTGSTEGFVKRISVRATEIETFEKQSIIVPNSELINGTVGNWNHRNSLGRADVMVGAGYDADPEEVLRILEEIALAHPLVLRNPPPVVHFVDFGASSLDFVVKVFLADVLSQMAVKNDLRVAIYKRFKAEGIEIPFPKSDVNFTLKNVPDELLQQLAKSAGATGAKDSDEQDGPDAAKSSGGQPRRDAPEDGEADS